MGKFPNQPGWDYIPAQSEEDTKEFSEAIAWGIRQWWTLLSVSSPLIVAVIATVGFAGGKLKLGDYVLVPIVFAFSLWLAKRRLRYLFRSGVRAGVIKLVVIAVFMVGFAAMAYEANFAF